MLTPLDLNNKNFSKGFRGYDTEEVDEFFAKVAKDFERLNPPCRTLWSSRRKLPTK